MAWSSDGSLLASGAKDGSVFIWPTRANSGEDEIPGDWTPLGFSTDGRSLAAIHPSGTVSFFNLETRESERELPGKPVDAGPFGLAAAANPGLSVLTRADGPGALEILDLADGQRRVLRAARGRHRDLALSPDGRQLVAAMGNQRILW